MQTQVKGKARVFWEPWRVQAAVALYVDAGWTQERIARWVPCCPETVARHLVAEGVVIRCGGAPAGQDAPRVTEDEEERMLELHGEGKTIREIARLLNRTRPTIYAHLRLRGAIPQRRGGERAKEE